jgi:hypothetical protein
MRNRVWILVLGLAALLPNVDAAGTEPKAKPSDYQFQAETPKGVLAFDFLVRTFFGAKQSYVADDYLVFEVALFPKGGERGQGEPWMASTSHFTLRINGKKQAVYAQTPGMVAASLKYPDWSFQRGGSVSAGAGDSQITLGGPGVPTSRFPGDQRDPRSRMPRRPDVATSPVQSQEEPENPAQVVVDRALVEAATRGPMSGYLYFAQKGNVDKMKTIELHYHVDGTAEPIIVKIR